MSHYLVISPELSETIPILDDGTGPLEYYRCVVEIEAKNKRDAKIQAIRHLDMQEWVEHQRSDGRNPFTGLKCYCGQSDICTIDVQPLMEA